MSAARTATRRSHHDIPGATKAVKTAARVQQPCSGGPWFRSSSLAADPSGSGRSAAALGVSSALAPCQALLRIPLGLVTRCERERLAAASAVQLLRVALRVECSGLGPGCFKQRCYAQQHRPHCQTGQDAVTSLWTAAIVLGVVSGPNCHEVQPSRLPRSYQAGQDCGQGAATVRQWALVSTFESGC